MTINTRFSANINTFNAGADRYVLSGYGERYSTEELIKMATQVEGLTGVELVGLWHVNDNNVEQIRRQVGDAGLVVTCVTPDIWASAKWGHGSLASHRSHHPQGSYPGSQRVDAAGEAVELRSNRSVVRIRMATIIHFKAITSRHGTCSSRVCWSARSTCLKSRSFWSTSPRSPGLTATLRQSARPCC